MTEEDKKSLKESIKELTPAGIESQQEAIYEAIDKTDMTEEDKTFLKESIKELTPAGIESQQEAIYEAIDKTDMTAENKKSLEESIESLTSSTTESKRKEISEAIDKTDMTEEDKKSLKNRIKELTPAGIESKKKEISSNIDSLMVTLKEEDKEALKESIESLTPAGIESKKKEIYKVIDKHYNEESHKKSIESLTSSTTESQKKAISEAIDSTYKAEKTRTFLKESIESLTSSTTESQKKAISGTMTKYIKELATKSTVKLEVFKECSELLPKNPGEEISKDTLQQIQEKLSDKLTVTQSEKQKLSDLEKIQEHCKQVLKNPAQYIDNPQQPNMLSDKASKEIKKKFEGAKQQLGSKNSPVYNIIKGCQKYLTESRVFLGNLQKMCDTLETNIETEQEANSQAKFELSVALGYCSSLQDETALSKTFNNEIQTLILEADKRSSELDSPVQELLKKYADSPTKKAETLLRKLNGVVSSLSIGGIDAEVQKVCRDSLSALKQRLEVKEDISPQSSWMLSAFSSLPQDTCIYGKSEVSQDDSMTQQKSNPLLQEAQGLATGLKQDVVGAISDVSNTSTPKAPEAQEASSSRSQQDTKAPISR